MYAYHDDQGILLHYSDHSLLKNSKSKNVDKKCTTTVTMRNISVYHNYHYYYKDIISVQIEPYQTEDGIEIIISNSQFHRITQEILYINVNSNTTKCKIWIINFIFKNITNPRQNSSIIGVKVPLFNMTLIFFKCEFHNNCVTDGYLVFVGVYQYKVNSAAHRDVRFTNITFNKCSFNRNKGTTLYLTNCITNQLKLSVSFVHIGVDHNNWLNLYDEAICITNMVVHIHGPVNIK